MSYFALSRPKCAWNGLKLSHGIRVLFFHIRLLLATQDFLYFQMSVLVLEASSLNVALQEIKRAIITSWLTASKQLYLVICLQFRSMQRTATQRRRGNGYKSEEEGMYSSFLVSYIYQITGNVPIRKMYISSWKKILPSLDITNIYCQRCLKQLNFAFMLASVAKPINLVVYSLKAVSSVHSNSPLIIGSGMCKSGIHSKLHYINIITLHAKEVP